MERWCVFVGVAAVMLCSVQLCAQRPCEQGAPELVPGRPTYSNAAATTACGHLEVDLGWSRQRLAGDARQDTFSTSLRLGLTRRMDAQWSFDGFQRAASGGRATRHIGDNALALRWRAAEQRKYLPAIALRYAAKFPTAPESVGGSGYYDHQLALLVSRDIRRVHIDGNLIETFYGVHSGFQRAATGAISLSGALTRRNGLVLESYGGRLADGRTFASQYAGTTWNWSSRAVIDFGVDFGLTSSAPRHRLVTGLSYSIAPRRTVEHTSAASQPRSDKGE